MDQSLSPRRLILPLNYITIRIHLSNFAVSISLFRGSELLRARAGGRVPTHGGPVGPKIIAIPEIFPLYGGYKFLHFGRPGMSISLF